VVGHIQHKWVYHVIQRAISLVGFLNRKVLFCDEPDSEGRAQVLEINASRSELSLVVNISFKPTEEKIIWL
jgi:ATP-dependent 26S proteasome regulatory subunit